MTFTTGEIADVIWKPLNFYHDSRGWLTELAAGNRTECPR